MVSDLAQKNIAKYEVKPSCGNCDFWGMYATDHGIRRGECRIHRFDTQISMVCDEWELD